MKLITKETIIIIVLLVGIITTTHMLIQIDELKNTNTSIIANISNMTKHIHDMDKILERVILTDVDFTLNVEPKSVSGRDEIRIFGTADQAKRDSVQIDIYLPNSKSGVSSILIADVKNNNTFDRTVKTGSNKWTIDGDYRITGYHTHTETVFLSYSRNSTGN